MVVGAFVGEKPDFTPVAHFGILSHDIAMISLNKAHYINQGINKNKALSVNIVDESRLEKPQSREASRAGLRTNRLFSSTVWERRTRRL